MSPFKFQEQNDEYPSHVPSFTPSPTKSQQAPKPGLNPSIMVNQNLIKNGVKLVRKLNDQ